LGIASGQEWSSANQGIQCLEESGAEEKHGLNSGGGIMSILGHACNFSFSPAFCKKIQKFLF
jgi:hypothetical protein